MKTPTLSEVRSNIDRGTAISAINPQRFRRSTRQEQDELVRARNKLLANIRKPVTRIDALEMLPANVVAACRDCGRFCQRLHTKGCNCRSHRGSKYTCRCGAGVDRLVALPTPYQLDTLTKSTDRTFECYNCGKLFRYWKLFGCLCPYNSVKSNTPQGHGMYTQCRECCTERAQTPEPKTKQPKELRRVVYRNVPHGDNVGTVVTTEAGQLLQFAELERQIAERWQQQAQAGLRAQGTRERRQRLPFERYRTFPPPTEVDVRLEAGVREVVNYGPDDDDNPF